MMPRCPYGVPVPRDQRRSPQQHIRHEGHERSKRWKVEFTPKANKRRSDMRAHSCWGRYLHLRISPVTLKHERGCYVSAKVRCQMTSVDRSRQGTRLEHLKIKERRGALSTPPTTSTTRNATKKQKHIIITTCHYHHDDDE